jgi:NADH-quinone oxidoreductase subunit F
VNPALPLTGAMGPGRTPWSLREYEQAGGYEAARQALRAMTGTQIVDAVRDAGLRGRGGAGFPTGLKWSFMPRGADAPRPKHLVCNADEMEPGTFKDRFLLEGEPHLLIEGLIVSAFALEVEEAVIFLRQGYAAAEGALAQALAEAYGRGHLGRDVLGTGQRLEVRLHVSAGRYICGEETALLNALEGRRPIPRVKPPHPQASGLWGRPTVVNNVETLCNVPQIVLRGAEWFKGLGRGSEGGTKIYGVSGKVRRPGAWELPMGTPLRELIEVHAGGLREGHALRGLLPGGASTDFLLPRHLDVPLDFDSVQKAGSRLGTGTVVVLDDRTCPVGMLLSLERFFARESCGWCTPCREGLPWVEETLRALEEGRGTGEDLEILEEHTRQLGPGRTFCAHAPGAMAPLQSALAFFREDFERHVTERRCPWKS